MTALAQRQSPAAALLALLAIPLGVMIGMNPLVATAMVLGASVLALAFVAPVVHLGLLLLVTAVVPFEVMNQYGFPSGSTGIVASDALLLTGLLRAAIVLLPSPLQRAELWLLAGVTAFLALIGVQFFHGVVMGGASLSFAGTELRTLMGFGAAIVALAIVRDPDTHGRVLVMLAAVGLTIGLMGLAQWFLGLGFAGSGDFGVREGVSLTSSGTGQLQGGLYSYPVICILAFAALVSSRLHGPGTRTLVLGILIINALCLLLTFERTFWVVTVLGCGVVALRAERLQRAKVVLMVPVLVVFGFAALAVVAPSTLTTARERLLSIGQYGSDFSVDYRVRESKFVIEEIRASPLTGSGLGATIFWGVPRFQIPAESKNYSHNGYLWTVWKLGIPGALLLLALFLGTILVRRGPPTCTFDLVVIGAQASLLALLITNVTFPSVSGLTSNPTTGVLMALCVAPVTRRSGA